MNQILLQLPTHLAERLRAHVPSGKRNKYIARLIEKDLASRDEELYRLAMHVEQDEALTREMREWDATAGDGL